MSSHAGVHENIVVCIVLMDSIKQIKQTSSAAFYERLGVG